MLPSVSCKIRGFKYDPVIEETAENFILKGGLTDRDGHRIIVGDFRIPKDVTRVELRGDADDLFLAEIRPTRGWFTSINGKPSQETTVG